MSEPTPGEGAGQPDSGGQHGPSGPEQSPWSAPQPPWNAPQQQAPPGGWPPPQQQPGQPPGWPPQQQPGPPPGWPQQQPQWNGPQQQGPPPGGSGPNRRTLTILLGILAVVVLVAGVAVARIIFPGQPLTPTTDGRKTSATSAPTTTAAADLGAIGASLVPLGFVCLEELPSPQIEGCYHHAQDKTTSLRWQGGAGSPTSVIASTHTRNDNVDELNDVLAGFGAAARWSTADIAKIRTAAQAHKTAPTTVAIAGGTVGVTYYKGIEAVYLTGDATGQHGKTVKGTQMTGSLDDAQQKAVGLGYTCRRSTDPSFTDIDCSKSDAALYFSEFDKQFDSVSLSDQKSATVQDLTARPDDDRRPRRPAPGRRRKPDGRQRAQRGVGQRLAGQLQPSSRLHLHRLRGRFGGLTPTAPSSRAPRSTAGRR